MTLLIIALAAIVLAAALFLVEMNAVGLLVGEHVVSFDGTIEVTLKAAMTCIICTLILYWLNRHANMNDVQLVFYRNKFIIKSLGLFMLSSTVVLFHYEPIYDNPKWGLLLRLDAYIVFLVYVPTAIIAYRKLWLCPKYGKRHMFGFSFFLSQLFSLDNRKVENRKFLQHEQDAKSCQYCGVLLLP
jgi:hypothetical protein